MSTAEVHENVDQPGAPVDEDVSAFDFIVLLLSHWRKLILLPLACSCLVLGLTYLIEPTYIASTRLLTPQQTASTAASVLGALGGAAPALSGFTGLKNPSDKWVGLLKSRVIADSIVRKFSLAELYGTKFTFEAREALASRTNISAGKDSLITIEVEDTKPERAAQIVETYVEELQKLTNTLAVTEAAQRRLFFEKRLAEAQAGLVKAEISLRDGGIGSDLLKTRPEAAVEQIARMQAAVAAQEVRLQVLQGAMTSNNPEYQRAAIELGSLREQLKRAERDQPAAGTPKSIENYVVRYREFKYFETLYELFARQYELARADEAKDGALIQVVDPVLTPEYKSKPKRLMAALIGLFASFVLVVILILLNKAFGDWRLRQARQR